MANCTTYFSVDFPLRIHNKSSFQGTLNIFFELPKSRLKDREAKRCMWELGYEYISSKEWRKINE